MMPEFLARSLRVLNLIDVLATLWTVGHLGADDFNPLMGALAKSNPMLFTVGKILVVYAFSEFLVKHAGRRAALVGLVTLNLLFLVAVAAHVACVV